MVSVEDKLYAVRKPAEAKGVYTTAAEIKEVRKKYSKGLSVKEFKVEEVEAARAWAGVKGTVGTPMTTVKETVSQTKASASVDLKAIEKLLTKLTLETKTESFKQVLQSYQKKGYRHLKLTLVTGETLFITIKDEVYLPNQYHESKNFDLVDLTDYRKDRTSRYSSIVYDYAHVIIASLKTVKANNLSPVKDALKHQLIDLLPMTKIEYASNHITFSNFNSNKEQICVKNEGGSHACVYKNIYEKDLHQTYRDENGTRPDNRFSITRQFFQHADQMKTVSVDAIISIEPYSLGLENRYLDIPGLPDLIRKASAEL